MIKSITCTLPVTLFGLSLICFYSTGCWKGSPVALPEAPPPYPDSPYPYGDQSETYVPPPSPSPHRNSFAGGKQNSPSTQRSFGKTYTIKAIGTIWVLVQDKFGNELEWLSLMTGQETSLKHTGPLTLTCSSNESLKIFDPDGKPFPVVGNKKGIIIIRLP